MWFGSHTLAETFPALFSHTLGPNAYVARVLMVPSLQLSLRPRLTNTASSELSELTALMSSVELDPSSNDARVLRSNNRPPTSKDHYLASFQEFPDDPFAPAIWRSYTPQKCKFFLWLLHKNRLRTKARLLHCHMHNNGECPFCTAEEDCFHLFINCLVVKAFGYSSALTLLPSLKHLVLISFGRLIPSRKMIAELPAQFSFVSFGIFGSAEMQKFSGTMMRVTSYFREDAVKILSYGHTDALLLLEK